MEEDGELPKTLVKLRRTPSDTPRPASTPPVIAASAIQDENDEEKIIAELEVCLVKLPNRDFKLFIPDLCCPFQCDNMSLPHSLIQQPRIKDISENACKRL